MHNKIKKKTPINLAAANPLLYSSLVLLTDKLDIELQSIATLGLYSYCKYNAKMCKDSKLG